MAIINNRFIHFKYKSDFDSRYAETTDNGMTYGDFLGKSIVFIRDANKIWTHGHFYDCGGYETPIEVTYAELRNLIENSQLIPKQIYHLTDYQSVYYSSKGGQTILYEETGDVRGTAALLGTDNLIGDDGVAHPSDVYTLELHAVSETTLSQDAKIIKVNGISSDNLSELKKYPVNFYDWKIKYNPKFFAEFGDSYKGWITYMGDDVSQNEFHYDVFNCVWWRTGLEMSTWGDTVHSNGAYLHTFNVMDSTFSYYPLPAHQLRKVKILAGKADTPDTASWVPGFASGPANLQSTGYSMYHGGNNVFIKTVTDVIDDSHSIYTSAGYSIGNVNLTLYCYSNTFVFYLNMADVLIKEFGRYHSWIVPNQEIAYIVFNSYCKDGSLIRGKAFNPAVASENRGIKWIDVVANSKFRIINDDSIVQNTCYLQRCTLAGNDWTMFLGDAVLQSNLLLYTGVFYVRGVQYSNIGRSNENSRQEPGKIVGTSANTEIYGSDIQKSLYVCVKTDAQNRIQYVRNDCIADSRIYYLLTDSKKTMANTVINDARASGIDFYLDAGTGSVIYELRLTGTCGFGSTAALYNAKKAIDISCDQGGMSVNVDLSPEVITVTRRYRTGETSVKLYKITSLPDFTE